MTILKEVWIKDGFQIDYKIHKGHVRAPLPKV